MTFFSTVAKSNKNTHQRVRLCAARANARDRWVGLADHVDTIPHPAHGERRGGAKTDAIGENASGVSTIHKNLHPIYRAISPTYKIERDFGGSFDPAANAIVNFSMSFPFDNADLRPEFKDHGWTTFRRRISHDNFDETASGEICAPGGAADAAPLPIAQLCFGPGSGSASSDQWRITRHINGGD